MKQIRAVGAVVYRRRDRGAIEILVIKKVKGYWSLPKGKLKSGEDPSAALLREVHEETGITGVIEELIAEATYTIEKPAGPRRKHVTYYLVRATDGVIKPGAHEQIVEVAWMPLRRALVRVRRRRLRAVLQAAQTLFGPVRDQG